jgi:hypothetical protein
MPTHASSTHAQAIRTFSTNAAKEGFDMQYTGSACSQAFAAPGTSDVCVFHLQPPHVTQNTFDDKTTIPL